MDPRQVFRSYDPGSAVQAADWTWCPICGGALARANQAGVGRSTCAACGWVHYRNPTPGVVVLVRSGRSVLLGRRGPGSYLPGLWCLPGGYQEWDEDFLTAGRREVREETGLEVTIRSILSVVSNHLTPALHTLVVVLLATPAGGRERPGDDLEELGWYPLEGALPDLAFEADRHIIARVAERPFAGAPVDPRFAGSLTGDAYTS